MFKIDYSGFKKKAEDSKLHVLAEKFYGKSQEIIDACNHGDLDMWLEAISELPKIDLSSVDISSDTIRAGLAKDCDDDCRKKLHDCMQKLRPWRKGPFEICGMKIDTEWRSDWKWNRLKNHISCLKDRVVLDIGCGSGYHTWRMAGAGAKLAIGVEPYKVFVMQYWAMKYFLQNDNAWVLPLAVEDIPPEMRVFDTVFSMGVLYHRKSPMEHLLQIRDMLRSGGELVLETLVIEGDENTVFVSEDRYAQMRNVWFLPSPPALEKWLRKLGFKDVRTVDVNQTSIEEQRHTNWMRWKSLEDYLDPKDFNKTLEGYPAPRRAITLATAP